jgi:hypothetical protein
MPSSTISTLRAETAPLPEATILNLSVTSGNLILGGSVNIGTITPATPLVVASGNVTGSYKIYNGLTVRPYTGSGGYGESGSSIYIGAVTNHGIDPVAGIWSVLTNGGDGGVNSGALVLGATSQGNATPTEGARMDGSGNFGIGTKSPTARLEVNVVEPRSSFPMGRYKARHGRELLAAG